MRRFIFTQGLLAAVAASISFFVAPPHAAGAWTQWTTGTGANGHYYDVISNPNSRGPGLGITWQNAEADAVARGGHLASVTSTAEQSYVFNLAKSVPSAWWYRYGWDTWWGPWLGGRQNPLPTTFGPSYANTNWSWTNGDQWSYTNWGPSQPNDLDSTVNGVNGGEEDKLIFYGPGYTTGGVANPVSIAGASGWCDIMSIDPSGQSPIGYVIEKAPEPSTFVLLGMGALSVLAYVWRRKQMA